MGIHLENFKVASSGIYVASRVKHYALWQHYKANGILINSTWINEPGDGDIEDFGELWARIETEIRKSTVLVFYVHGEEDLPLKGALVEVGMALAMNKPVFAVLEDITTIGRTMRPIGSWILDKRVIRFNTLDAAFRSL